MGLTADHLAQALAASAGDQPDSPAEAVLLVQRTQPSFAATLYSAWQAEGGLLNAGLLHALAAARARIDYYRAVANWLSAQVPGLTPIKGLEVAGLYPAGLTRAMNDLDYVAPAERDLWQAVALLTDDGWDLDTATFSKAGGALQVMVSLRRPHEDPYLMPYGIELATYYSLGNFCGVPPLLSLPASWREPAIKNTLMLLCERFEQPYRARDLVDAALLLGSVRGDDLAVLQQALTQLRLRAEYAELVSLVDRTDLDPLPAPPGGDAAAGLARARRIASGAGFFRRPLAGSARHLQRRQIGARPGRVERRAWAATQRLLPVGSGVGAGVLGFGLPLDGPPPAVDAAILHTRGRLAWVDTPVARFLLTIGDHVAQAAVDELSASDPAASGDPLPASDLLVAGDTVSAGDPLPASDPAAASDPLPASDPVRGYAATDTAAARAAR
jgi:hypothetical protein